MSKISIIAPIFNQEVNMRTCIESVLSQTLTDFELILINNGSSDNSGIICDEYSRKDNRIVVLHRDNYDLGAARNDGISFSSGEYIVFIDCDDFIHIELLKVLYEDNILCVAENAMCVYHNII